MKIGKWLLVAAAAVIVGIRVWKRLNTQPLATLHEDESLDQSYARKILSRVYKLDEAGLKRFINRDLFVLDLPRSMYNAVARHRRGEEDLTTEGFVTWLEVLAGVDTSKLVGQSDSTQKLIVSQGYGHGTIPFWVGRWWHRAIQEYNEPDFRDFNELLAQHTEK